jgi:hypothetical protein
MAAKRDEAMARRSLNTCPICWMPLNVGNGTHADKWKRVQITFKAKPAFSLRENSIDYSRVVVVFGTHSLVGLNRHNYEGSHYVHKSMAGDLQTLSKTYEMGNYPGEHAHVTGLSGHNGPVLKPEFFKFLFESGSIFGSAFEEGSLINGLLDELVKDDGDVQRLILPLQTKFVNETFMGCVDCNGRMTVSDFVGDLFDMVFPSDTYEPAMRATANKPRNPRADGFTTEAMIHYIMLGGLMNDTCRVSSYLGSYRPENNELKFNIRDEKQRRHWFLKYLMMWCALQIQFCSWKMGSLYDGLRHHSDYIYRGVMDFYLSLWLYSLYFISTARTETVEFVEFHYYYSSMMPFYRNGHTESGNLSGFVFEEPLLAGSKMPHMQRDRLDKVKQDMQYLFDQVVNFWTDHMQAVCNAIHTAPDRAPVCDYFSSFKAIQDTRAAVSGRAFDFHLQTFCDQLTPFWYWFHFKHITLPVLTRTSRKYHEWLQGRQDARQARILWFAWRKVFSNRVSELSVRFYMEQQRALRARLRMDSVKRLVL